jgi:hypothetical protein
MPAVGYLGGLLKRDTTLGFPKRNGQSPLRMTFRSLLGLGFTSWLLVACGGEAGSSPAQAGAPGAPGASGSAGTGGALATGGHPGAGAGGMAGASSSSAGVGGGHGGSTGSSAGSGGAAAGTGGNASGGTASGGTASGGTASGGTASGGTAGGGTAGGGIALLTPTINAYCQAAQSCCTKQGIPAMLTDCASMFPTRDKVLASIDTGGVTVNAPALAKCLAAYQDAATTCDENLVVSACTGVFSGTKAAGEPCANGSECNTAQGPTTCLFVGDNTSPGVCKLTLHGKSGDACVSTCPTSGDCSYETYGAADSPLTWCFEAEGLYCDFSSTTCQPLVALGKACSFSDACGSGNLCDLVCKKGVKLGQSCAVNACINELECSPDSGTCVDPPFANDSVCMGYSLGPS